MPMARRDSGFEHVYAEHVWRVYAFISYRVRDHELAQDLTQGTFERALRAWGRFDARRASEATWLLAIARNVVIDSHRRERIVLEELPHDAQIGSEPSPEERFAGSPELLAALQELGDQEREIIALRFGGDLTAAEIASLLGLTVANVQQILSRSTRRLRSLIEKEGPKPRGGVATYGSGLPHEAGE
jgi:RNA polymerase sigma-70 factor (ECF subfamily)